jgi:hypothetical protein
MTNLWPIKPWAGSISLQTDERDGDLAVSPELFETLDNRGLWRTLYEECNLTLSMDSVVRVPPELCEEIARVAALGNKPWPGDPMPDVLPFIQAFEALARKAQKHNVPLVFRPRK